MIFAAEGESVDRTGAFYAGKASHRTEEFLINRAALLRSLVTFVGGEDYGGENVVGLETRISSERLSEAS